MSEKVDLSKYIVSVSGRDFITFPGLLAIAHEKGLTSIETELVNEDPTNPIMKATVKFGDKVFTGHGDASAKNVNPKVAAALVRISETRSIARSLRFACNIDMTAIEELDANEEVVEKKPPQPARTGFNRTKIVQLQTPSGTTTVSIPENVVVEPTATPIQQPQQPVVAQPSTTGTPPPTPMPSTTVPRTFGKRTTTTTTAQTKTEPKFP